MKTFELNQKVTHTTKGVGIVKRLRNNDTQAFVDFKGHGIWVTSNDKYITHGANEYKPKQTPEAIKVLVEVQKLQQMVQERIRETDPRQSDFAKGCNSYARMIDEHLENILQGINK